MIYDQKMKDDIKEFHALRTIVNIFNGTDLLLPSTIGRIIKLNGSTWTAREHELRDYFNSL